jgi:excisionase family DNA binding protein
MENPFAEISDRLKNVETMLSQILNNSENKAEKKYLNVQEAAKYLKLSPSLIYRLTSHSTESDKKIPFIKKGRRLLFVPSELDKWVVSNG